MDYILYANPQSAWVLDPDVLTIAWLLDPSLATTAEDYLDVSLEGITRGMTCCYGRDTLRLNIGIPEPKGAQVTIRRASITRGLFR